MGCWILGALPLARQKIAFIVVTCCHNQHCYMKYMLAEGREASGVNELPDSAFRPDAYASRLTRNSVPKRLVSTVAVSVALRA